MNTDMFPDEDILRNAENGDPSALAALDSAGFLIKPGETSGSFVGRIRAMHLKALAFQEKMAEGKPVGIYRNIVLKESERIPDEIIDEAARTTLALYSFSIRWVPGYFLSGGLGWLWGGCALSDDEEDSVPVFVIRSSFRNSRKWFLYTRDELLSHELCHAARAPLDDSTFEEHFAYAGSSSRLRRYLGNCFQTELDALFFLIPILILLAVQILVHAFGISIPVWPFWILAFAYPAYLFRRNASQRKLYFDAEERLRALGFENPREVLFRCTSDEINRIARTTMTEVREWMKKTAEQEIRIKIILQRFLTGGTKNADNSGSDTLS